MAPYPEESPVHASEVLDIPFFSYMYMQKFLP